MQGKVQPRSQDRECTCGGTMTWSKHCAAYVCESCDKHDGLARCYCGWSASGGNGRQELIDLGETIDPEE